MRTEEIEAARMKVRREAAHLVTANKNGAQSSIIALIDALITHAYCEGASDLHLVPSKDMVLARLRIDSKLEDAHAFPLLFHSELITRLKILSGIRTDEHYIAQDGRFRFALETEKSIDIRVSIAPTFYGENAVLRILSLNMQTGTLEQLGFSLAHQSLLEEMMRRPHGMILVTGPTGSGKTTTLYTLLTALTQEDQSIVTIEDPIEYPLDGVTQIQLNPLRGFSFAQSLRSIVRQDPDIIMIGEIRDTETAQLACTAALTGHLVLSTLHTNDAGAALMRLRDLGVEPYVIQSSLNLVVAQRLVRRICSACASPRVLNAKEIHTYEDILKSLEINGAPETYFAHGSGCDTCNGTGYRGRIGICELLNAQESAQVLVSLLHDGLGKALAGIISFDDLTRFIHS